MPSSPNIAALILAAGGSTRLGRPKQLLPFDGGTLLGHACRTALESGCDPVVVVIGSSAGLVRAALEPFPIEIVENPEWERGLGTSLKAGVRAVASRPGVAATLVMLCDQPLLTSAHLSALIESYVATGKPLVASAYAGSLGVPTLFDRSLFAELQAVEDGGGAKGLIARDSSRLASVAFAEGEVDVDTQARYEALMQWGGKAPIAEPRA